MLFARENCHAVPDNFGWNHAEQNKLEGQIFDYFTHL